MHFFWEILLYTASRNIRIERQHNFLGCFYFLWQMMSSTSYLPAVTKWKEVSQYFYRGEMFGDGSQRDTWRYISQSLWISSLACESFCYWRCLRAVGVKFQKSCFRTSSVIRVCGKIVRGIKFGIKFWAFSILLKKKGCGLWWFLLHPMYSKIESLTSLSMAGTREV